jgi:hypothetical protein
MNSEINEKWPAISNMRKLMRSKPLQFQGKSPDRALGDHITPSPTPVAPNAIAVACRALFPWSNAANKRDRQAYPGAHGGPCALVQGRAAQRTVRDWIADRRNAPKWFVRLLDDELAMRQQAIQEARRLLAAYQQGPGRAAPLQRYWHERWLSEHSR